MKKDSQEYKDWCELFEYVKKDILEYNQDMKMPKYMILRLQGLRQGKFMANKKQKPLANYKCKTILLTFKFCKAKINSYIKSNSFKNEQHKFNGIMVIIENEINNTVNMLKKAKKSEDDINSLKLDNQINEGAKYKNKSNINKNLQHLW